MIPKKNYCRQIRWTALLLVLVLVPRDCGRMQVVYQEQHADGTPAGAYFVEVPL